MDLKFMRRALDLAGQAAAIGEVPVGAVIVNRNTGEIVGEGFNKRESRHSPLAHAELLAIDEASRNTDNWRLEGYDMYVTLEPCAMCSGALINARIDRVFFGAYDKRFGACGSVVKLFDLPFNHSPELEGGVLEEECSAVLTEFFERLREHGEKRDELSYKKRESLKNETEGLFVKGIELHITFDEGCAVTLDGEIVYEDKTPRAIQIVREYLDVPRDEVFERELGELGEILKAADRRCGKRNLRRLEKESKSEAAKKIIAKRSSRTG